MFKYLVEKYKAWRAECQAVNAKIKADREARRLKAEEDTKQRLKDLQDAETKRREAEQAAARKKFKDEVYLAITTDIHHLDAYYSTSKPESRVSWLFASRSDTDRYRVRWLMEDPKYDSHYFKQLLDEEIDRYSREEVEGCKKYYDLVEQKRKIDCRPRYERIYWGEPIEPAEHVAKDIRKAVINRALNEALAFSTLTWPTHEEILNHPDLDFSMDSIPYQRHKLVPENAVEMIKGEFTVEVIGELIEGFYGVRNAIESPTRPYSLKMREKMVKYLIGRIRYRWKEYLAGIESDFLKRYAQERTQHLKRHHVSRQKALTTGPKISKRFPLTRSIN